MSSSLRKKTAPLPQQQPPVWLIQKSKTKRLSQEQRNNNIATDNDRNDNGVTVTVVEPFDFVPRWYIYGTLLLSLQNDEKEQHKKPSNYKNYKTWDNFFTSGDETTIIRGEKPEDSNSKSSIDNDNNADNIGRDRLDQQQRCQYQRQQFWTPPDLLNSSEQQEGDTATTTTANTTTTNNLFFHQFLNHMNGLSGLEIEIPYINFKHATIQCNDITTLLDKHRSSSTFRSLILWPYVCIHINNSFSSMISQYNNSTEDDCNKNDVIRISQVLYNHPTLETFALMSMLFVGNSDSSNTSTIISNESDDDDVVSHQESGFLDPLFHSLSSIPNLSNLQLVAGVNCKATTNTTSTTPNENTTIDESIPISTTTTNLVCSIDAVTALFNHMKLQYVSFRNLGMNDLYVQKMIETLVVNKHTTMLQSLDLRYNTITMIGYKAIHEMLYTNNDNYTIQYIEMDETNIVCCSDCCCHAATTTNSNRFDNKKSKNICRRTVMKEEINFMLLVNRTNRYKLLRSTQGLCQETALEVLANAASVVDDDDAVTNDNKYGTLDVLYYLIRSNPSIVMILSS